jgi:hypothetical protein
MKLKKILHLMIATTFAMGLLFTPFSMKMAQSSAKANNSHCITIANEVASNNLLSDSNMGDNQDMSHHTKSIKITQNECCTPICLGFSLPSHVAMNFKTPPSSALVVLHISSLESEKTEGFKRPPKS